MPFPRDFGDNDDLSGFEEDEEEQITVKDKTENDEEDDELDAFMAGIEKEAAKDKETSEQKAKSMETKDNYGAGPSNRVDLDAEDDHDEFILNYDPEKMGLNDEYEEIDDYALVEVGPNRDVEGEIIYQGSKRKAYVPATAGLESNDNETEKKHEDSNNITKKIIQNKPPSNPKEQLKKYKKWGFVAATKAETGIAVPPPPPISIPPPPPPDSGVFIPPPPPPTNELIEEANPPKRSRWT